MKLGKAFYTREDAITISKELLGKFLVTCIDGRLTSGMIVETEAYLGAEDKASHAYGNRRTKRTEPFYKEGGIAYVYLCYGIHYLFNIITNKAEIPHAVLIRAVEPSDGIDIMLERRKKAKLTPELTAGPGALSVALGISARHNETDLLENEIWVEDRGGVVNENEIIASPRVGVAYAKEYALKPWRFRVKDNPYTSKAR
jgi:DNA-3-methyladenine glycosylase